MILVMKTNNFCTSFSEWLGTEVRMDQALRKTVDFPSGFRQAIAPILYRPVILMVF
jgi:hypothetical protein